jgi:hypothetical protein
MDHENFYFCAYDTHYKGRVLSHDKTFRKNVVIKELLNN